VLVSAIKHAGFVNAEMRKMKYILSLVVFVMITTSLFGQSDSDRPIQPDIPGDISLDFGLTFLKNSEDFLLSKVWPSRVVGLHYMYMHKLNDVLTVNPALGFGMDRFGWQDNVNFLQDTSRLYQLDTIAGLTLKKNLLTYTYLELPLELRYYPFKTVKGEGFFIGAGAFAGLRLSSQTKIKYEFENANRVERDRADFGLNQFRYGVQTHIGWRQFSIFAKLYLNDMFDIKPAGANPRQFTFGLNFTGF
jgi:hypothetical protein